MVRARDDGCWPFGSHMDTSGPCELMLRYSPCLGVSLFRGSHRTSGLPPADAFALAGGGDLCGAFRCRPTSPPWRVSGCVIGIREIFVFEYQTQGLPREFATMVRPDMRQCTRQGASRQERDGGIGSRTLSHFGWSLAEPGQGGRGTRDDRAQGGGGVDPRCLIQHATTYSKSRSRDVLFVVMASHVPPDVFDEVLIRWVVCFQDYGRGGDQAVSQENIDCLSHASSLISSAPFAQASNRYQQLGDHWSPEEHPPIAPSA